MAAFPNQILSSVSFLHKNILSFQELSGAPQQQFDRF